jgi:hypothetical protein
MSSKITLGPFLRKFVHSDNTITSSFSTILDNPTIPEKRIVVILQNKGANVATVVLNAEGTAGLTLFPQATISVDNYNGVVRAISASGTVIHVAYSAV